MKDYISNDIFMLNTENDILTILLEKSSRQVMEYSMRLINILASECSGRSYLLKKEKIIDQLVKILYAEGKDTPLRQNTLGALQKFSLRRKSQSLMIQFDMIEWLVRILGKDPESLSDYSLEYATALLMNLSLRTQGKDRCELPSVDILNVLKEILEHENLQARTYVNGTLYSILTRNSLKERARELGLDEQLKELLKTSEEQFGRQIQYILDQLEAPQQDNNSEGEEDEENEEISEEDYFSEDEDTDDIIPGMPCGEDFFLKFQMANSQKVEVERDTSLPSELRPRPKIPRTPEVNQEQKQIKEQEHKQERVSTIIQTQTPLDISNPNLEKSSVFKNRPKINRTPPV